MCAYKVSMSLKYEWEYRNLDSGLWSEGLLSRLQANMKSLTVVFFIIDESYYSFWLSVKPGLPGVVFDLEVLKTFGQSFERVEFRIEEQQFKVHKFTEASLTIYECIFTVLQRELQRLAINMVCGPNKEHACRMRDWLEMEDFKEDGEESVRQNWQLEACRTAKWEDCSIKHIGMPGFHDSEDLSLCFGNRMVRQDGSVEWNTPDGQTESIIRPRWLVDIANGDMELERDNEMSLK